jgi:hypothetical protein
VLELDTKMKLNEAGKKKTGDIILTLDILRLEKFKVGL